MFTYDRWANTEFLNALVALPDPPSRSVQLLAHVVGAQQIWMERIESVAPAAKGWPEWDIQQCSENLAPVQQTWKDRIDAATEVTLRQSVAYTNSKGERWESIFEDIATHVAMHGTHHRGQIAANLRASGITPPYTDFIEAVRRGHLK